MVLSWPDKATAVSWEPIRANRFCPGVNGTLVSSDSCWLNRPANSGWALIPVPTAVPPWASDCNAGKVDSMCAMAAEICAAHPPSTWLMRTGMASIRWVRPVLMKGCTSSALRSIACTRCLSAGSSCSCKASAALT
ncbi:hypothetical protein D3C72_1891530 [compost metagenome]